MSLSVRDFRNFFFDSFFMPRILIMAFVVFLLLPSLAFAGCYAVYGNAYRNFYYKASGIHLPSRAGNFSSMGECRAFLNNMFSDPQYRYDTGLHTTQCQCDGGSGGASSGYAPSGGSFQQQIVSMAVSSILNALLSGLNAPQDSSGDEIRRKLQKQWDDDEAARKIAERKRQEAAFNTAQQSATALFGNRPAGRDGISTPIAPVVDDGAVYLGNGRIPALLRSSGAVTEAEWAEARRWQSRIDELWAKGSLTGAEAKELRELEAKRNALWKRATAVPGLTQRERDALRLKLRVSSAGAVTATTDEMIELRDKASSEKKAGPLGILSGMVESSMSYGIQTVVENWGEDTAEGAAKIIGKGKKVMKFGDAYFIVGSAAAIAQGKPEEVAEPAVTWAFGKLVTLMPSASLAAGTAQGVGAVTSATAKKSFEYLLEETDKIIPGFLPEGGAEAYWNARKAEATAAQRFGFEAWGW